MTARPKCALTRCYLHSLPRLLRTAGEAWGLLRVISLIPWCWENVSLTEQLQSPCPACLWLRGCGEQSILPGTESSKEMGNGEGMKGKTWDNFPKCSQRSSHLGLTAASHGNRPAGSCPCMSIYTQGLAVASKNSNPLSASSFLYFRGRAS